MFLRIANVQLQCRRCLLCVLCTHDYYWGTGGHSKEFQNICKTADYGSAHLKKSVLVCGQAAYDALA